MKIRKRILAILIAVLLLVQLVPPVFATTPAGQFMMDVSSAEAWPGDEVTIRVAMIEYQPPGWDNLGFNLIYDPRIVERVPGPHTAMFQQLDWLNWFGGGYVVNNDPMTAALISNAQHEFTTRIEPLAFCPNTPGLHVPREVTLRTQLPEGERREFFVTSHHEDLVLDDGRHLVPISFVLDGTQVTYVRRNHAWADVRFRIPDTATPGDVTELEWGFLSLPLHATTPVTPRPETFGEIRVLGEARTVTYRPYLGADTTHVVNTFYNSRHTLLSNAVTGFTQPGHTFVGWTIDGTDYAADENIIIRGDVTAVARWTTAQHTVTYQHGEDGS
ncbi:MAG: hypothetical protein FWC72_05095, partial [Oscillospiraceae bacterium]|nr:hypothetical protein [Oscillospiraceae bacterium]